MPTASHIEEATARDAEVAALHPDAERRQLRATFPARVVLRSIEREEQDPELGLASAAYVTAVVVDGVIEFYAGASPIWHAASIEASRVVGISVSHELEALRADVWPMLRLTITEGDTTLDLDLEVFSLRDGDLIRESALDPDLEWWKAALGL